MNSLCLETPDGRTIMRANTEHSAITDADILEATAAVRESVRPQVFLRLRNHWGMVLSEFTIETTAAEV